MEKCLVCGKEMPQEYSYSICGNCQVPTDPGIADRHKKILSTSPLANVGILEDNEELSLAEKFDFAANQLESLSFSLLVISNEKFEKAKIAAHIAAGVVEKRGRWDPPLPQPYSKWFKENCSIEGQLYNLIRVELEEDTLRTFRNKCEGIDNDSDKESEERCDICNLRRGDMTKRKWDNHLETC